MARTPITVTLAGEEFQIKCLTLRQLQDIGIDNARKGPDNASPDEVERFNYEKFTKIVSLGLISNHPTMTVEKLYGMEITLEELISAWVEVLAYSGLAVKKSSASGEAVAATR